MKERRRNPPSGALWNRQQYVIGVFDELIYNTDRNQGNLLVDPSWRIWMIDHTRAFRVDRRLRNAAKLAALRLEPPLAAALAALDRTALERCCGAYLTGEEMKALLARRDSILARFEGGRSAGAPQ